MRKIAILLATAILTAGPAIPCGAASGFCSCVGPSNPADALEAADAVFRGKVVEIEQRDGRLDAREYVMPRRVRVQVTERWKGAPGDTAIVYTRSGGGDCGYIFTSGREYLIYAHVHGDSALTTSICTRTRRATGTDARREIRELRRLTAAARQENRLRPGGGK